MGREGALIDEVRVCSRCGEEKPLSDYYKHKISRGGYRAQCKDCHNATINARLSTPEGREKHRESCKRWQMRNRDRRRELQRRRYLADPEAHVEKAKQWRRDNPGKSQQVVARRRAQKRRATPDWAVNHPLTRLKYSLAMWLRTKGEDVDVDHIIPLKPRHPDEPQGLHVPANLRIISSRENRYKSNRLLRDMTDKPREEIDWVRVGAELGEIVREHAQVSVQGIGEDIARYWKSIGLALVKASARRDENMVRELKAQVALLQGIHRVVLTREAKQALERALEYAGKVVVKLIPAIAGAV